MKYIDMQKRRTWALVADGARARILTGIGDAIGCDSTEYFQENEKARDLANDRPGRTHASADKNRSAYEPPSDPVRDKQRAFAAQLVQSLEKHMIANQFDALLVIAESRTLGHLRKLFPASLKERIEFEAAKDLTGLPDKALRKAIAELSSTANS